MLAIPLSSHLLPKMGPRAQDDRGDNDGDDFDYLMRMRWGKGGGGVELLTISMENPF